MLFALTAMNAFRDDRRFNLAIYHLENDEEKFTPERVISRLKAVETNARERDHQRQQGSSNTARVAADNTTAPRKEVECDRCNQKVHIARRCKAEIEDSDNDKKDGRRSDSPKKFAKKGSKQGQKGRNHAGAVAETNESANSDEYDFENACVVIDLDGNDADLESGDEYGYYNDFSEYPSDTDVDDDAWEAPGEQIPACTCEGRCHCAGPPRSGDDDDDDLNANTATVRCRCHQCNPWKACREDCVEKGQIILNKYPLKHDDVNNLNGDDCDVPAIDDDPMDTSSDGSGLVAIDSRFLEAPDIALTVKEPMACWLDDEDDHPWTIDSGATRHMCTNRKSFTRYEGKKTTVIVGGKQQLPSSGRGDIIVELDGSKRIIRNVLHIPGLGFNLLSIAALERGGLPILLAGGHVEIMRGGTSIAVGSKAGNLYQLARVSQNSALVASEEVSREDPVEAPPNDQVEGRGHSDRQSGRDGASDRGNDRLFELMHARLGHPSHARLMAMKKTVFGVPKITPPVSFFCDDCESNKMTRQMRRHRHNKETEPGSRLFCDIWGPYTVKTPIPSITPSRYFISIVDEATGTSYIQPDMTRTGVSRYLISSINRLDRQEGGITVRYVRCDNAKEFLTSESALQERGIELEPSTTHTPEQNGVAERFNRTIITMVRCMLHHAGLPDGFWPPAALYANHLRQRLPLADGASPYERWYKVKPLIDIERTFGMLCKVHIPREKGQSLTK